MDQIYVTISHGYKLYWVFDLQKSWWVFVKLSNMPTRVFGFVSGSDYINNS